MLCHDQRMQQMFRQLQEEHRLQQQNPKAGEQDRRWRDFRFATGSNGASSRQDDFSFTSSSTERSINGYKISLCTEFKATRYCRFGDACRFAHTYDELQLAKPRGKCNPKYKTRYCDKFSSTGYCKYGDQCQYIHLLLNETIRKERERRGVAMNINERPLFLYGRQVQAPHGDGLNVTVDERMNVMTDERMNVTIDERMNVTIDERMNVTMNEFAGQFKKYSNVNEKWTPFTKHIWGVQIEERLNTSLPALRPSIDPVSIEASFNGLLSH